MSDPATPEDGATAARLTLADDRASTALGIQALEITAGRAVLRMAVTADMLNGHGAMHGGYVFLLADSAFGFACNSHGQIAVAAGADITFVAPAGEGDVLIATAEERTRFGRNGVYDVTVTRGADVIAEFRGRSRTLPG